MMAQEVVRGGFGRRSVVGVALRSERFASGLIAHGFGDGGALRGSVCGGEVAE